METFLKIMGIIGIGLILLFIAPWFFFWISYFGGWVAKIVIGKYLVEGFGILGITLPLNKIPLIAGCFGWVGGFFKSTSFFNKNSEQ